MEGQKNLMDMLSDLKGAPLSIIVWFSLNGNRAVSASELAGEDATGFSDKPIKAGLMKLREMGLITEPRRNRFQLTGREYQLPLYWDEKMVPFGDSPKSIGDSPKFYGVSPDIEERLNRLENAVFGNAECSAVPLLDIPGRDPEDVPGLERSGSFPEKFGVSPNECGDGALFDIDGQWSDDCEGGEYSGNIPEKFGDSPNGEIREQSGDVAASGDSPMNVGDSPEKFGDTPKALIKNINIPEKEEVSKYESPDTYLLEKTNTEQGLTPDAETVWNVAMGQMKSAMGAVTFGTILREAVLIGHEDGHFTAAVKNRMVRDWADQRCRGQVERILSSASGRECTVSFVVDETNAECGMRNAEMSASLYEEPSLELLPVPDDPKAAELVEICNDYLLDPVGIEYSLDQLRSLTKMVPDPRVLQFILPRATKFEKAVEWCRESFVDAKISLLTYYKLTGKALTDLSTKDNVTLEMIQEECDRVIEELGKKNIGAAYNKIMALTGVKVLKM